MPMTDQPPPPTCYDKAVDLLARRAHFEAELRRKLLARGFEEVQVERALARLREKGYVDDARTAAQWVADQLARRPQGRRRLRQGLQRKGVDGEVATAALEALDDAAELDQARRAAAAWGARRTGRDDQLARHLDRRGFGTRVILTVLEERFEGPFGGSPCVDDDGVDSA
ncbi:MAG TPA: regulatory protein RecX [Thermoanaerobaculia bacterium]|nr:regulatory protein RecX [Thermoanaerobaculia bacterium]